MLHARENRDPSGAICDARAAGTQWRTSGNARAAFALVDSGGGGGSLIQPRAPELCARVCRRRDSPVSTLSKQLDRRRAEAGAGACVPAGSSLRRWRGAWLPALSRSPGRWRWCFPLPVATCSRTLVGRQPRLPRRDGIGDRPGGAAARLEPITATSGLARWFKMMSAPRQAVALRELTCRR